MNNEYAGALLSGTMLQGGTYKIEKVLGQGATGFTYLASMTQHVEGNLSGFDDKVNVAIKEFYLKNECQRGSTTLNVVIANTNLTGKVAQFKRSFIKEAKRIAGLSHPNIVHVLGIFEENGTVYYAMQYIRGGSLKDAIDREGAMPEDRVVKYASQVASALDYMHKKNMCHYDMKPGNIMLSSDDNAMLIDFGIAKNYDSNGQETSTTPPGLTKGFAPLEQYTSISGFSPQIDVYSLGATIYAMLLGTTPPEPMSWVGKSFMPKPANVSENLWHIVERAMALAAKDRPTMEELSNMLAHKETVVIDGGGDKTDYWDIEKDINPASDPNEDGTDGETVYGEDINGGTPVEPDKKPDEVNIDKPVVFVEPKKSNNLLFIVVAILLGLLVALGAFFIFSGTKPSKSGTPKEDADSTVVSTIYDTHGQAAMTYSGQVVNGQPQGRGVMKYLLDKDKDRYEGAFVNGLREDSAAALFFKNGDVYRGAFVADHFTTGAYYVNETGESFKGKFKDDQPWNGVWYDKHNNVISRIDAGQEK